MNVIDRAIAGKPSPVGTLAKEEQCLRDCYEARNGVGAAAALYQAALAKRLAREEDHAADMVAIAGGNKPVPTAVAASIARLKSEGIPVQQKLIILQNAMARPASPLMPSPAPVTPVSFAPPPAAPAPASGIKWDAKMLSALFDAVAGPGEATRATYHAIKVDLVKRSKAFAAVPPGSPVLSAEVAETLAREQQADEVAQAPAREAKDCERLKLHLLGFGVKVSGLSYAGLARPCSSEMVTDPVTRAQAQKNADLFMATLNGDPDAGCSDSPAAESARGLIRATSGHFTIGATFTPSKL